MITIESINNGYLVADGAFKLHCKDGEDVLAYVGKRLGAKGDSTI